MFGILSTEEPKLSVADQLKVAHDQTHGWDGYVNLELPPYLVFDAEAIDSTIVAQLETTIEQDKRALLAEEMERSHQAFERLLNTIEQKQQTS